MQQKLQEERNAIVFNNDISNNISNNNININIDNLSKVNNENLNIIDLTKNINVKQSVKQSVTQIEKKKINNDKLIFLKVISNVIKSGMNIIGVSTPEKM